MKIFYLYHIYTTGGMMKKFTYTFRSILVRNVEKLVPGAAYTKMVLEMDDNSIEQHTIELTSSQIFKTSSWIIGFMLSLMISSAVFLLSFGGVYLLYAQTMEQSAWAMTKTIFIASGILLFLILMIFFTARFSVQNKKREYVEKLRGKGNWKLVDEAKWDDFYRLLMIAKKNRG
jgi:hypothetical protein